MATLLQKIVERKHIKFIDQKVSWQEAVKLSTEALVADGTVDADFYQQIVACVEKYGPYVVFEHYVAMPHTQENAHGIHRTSVGLLISKEIVDFGVDEDGEKKEAKLLFTLASCNPDEHLDNIQQLMDIFTNEPLLDAMMEATTPEEILEAEAKYPPQEM